MQNEGEKTIIFLDDAFLAIYRKVAGWQKESRHRCSPISLNFPREPFLASKQERLNHGGPGGVGKSRRRGSSANKNSAGYISTYRNNERVPMCQKRISSLFLP